VASFLEKIASDSGVVLRSLTFERIGAEKETTTASLLNFSVGASGEYLKLKLFLNNLESSRRLININKTSFGQVKKEGSNEISLIITGQAYFTKVTK
jgi:Tfp pilus assembly protein PilO